jgi:phospholipid transport system substrate-binding protein
VVVRARLIRQDKSPVELDYVLRAGPTGWQVVDVLTDGTISRVAVQRSDFQQLLQSGGVAAALTAGLQRNVANLSGSMQG